MESVLLERIMKAESGNKTTAPFMNTKWSQYCERNELYQEQAKEPSVVHVLQYIIHRIDSNIYRMESLTW